MAPRRYHRIACLLRTTPVRRGTAIRHRHDGVTAPLRAVTSNTLSHIVSRRASQVRIHHRNGVRCMQPMGGIDMSDIDMSGIDMSGIDMSDIDIAAPRHTWQIPSLLAHVIGALIARRSRF